jgi:hypothetical protein
MSGRNVTRGRPHEKLFVLFAMPRAEIRLTTNVLPEPANRIDHLDGRHWHDDHHDNPRPCWRSPAPRRVAARRVAATADTVS